MIAVGPRSSLRKDKLMLDRSIIGELTLPVAGMNSRWGGSAPYSIQHGLDAGAPLHHGCIPCWPDRKTSCRWSGNENVHSWRLWTLLVRWPKPWKAWLHKPSALTVNDCRKQNTLPSKLLHKHCFKLVSWASFNVLSAFEPSMSSKETQSIGMRVLTSVQIVVAPIELDKQCL